MSHKSNISGITKYSKLCQQYTKIKKTNQDPGTVEFCLRSKQKLFEVVLSFFKWPTQAAD